MEWQAWIEVKFQLDQEARTDLKLSFIKGRPVEILVDHKISV